MSIPVVQEVPDTSGQSDVGRAVCGPSQLNGGVTMKSDLHLKNLVVPGVVVLAFWGIALWGFLASG